MQCSVVRINEQRYQSTRLGCPVPAVRAMHQHTHSFQTQGLEINGRDYQNTMYLCLSLSLSLSFVQTFAANIEHSIIS